MPLAVAAAAAAAGPLPDRLAERGIRPLVPPVAAPDFTLPLLAGGEAALSEHHGRWVLLTFFATWCGPCRTEMPTLERLHRALGDRGLSVLAVALDPERASLEPFVRELDLTLPVLWDRHGEVGASYRAGSIPISYVIDPAGSVVGIARGARDWAATEPLFAELGGALPAADTPSRYARGGPLQLPEVLQPPTADWTLPAGPLRPGRPFTLEVRLRWSGRLSDYLPQPPRVRLPEGVRQERVEATSGSGDRGQLVRYRIELVAERAGSYALDPIELRYLPALAEGPSTARVAGPTVEIAAAGLGGRTSAATGAAVAVALALAALWWRRRQSAAAPRPAPPWERLRRELDHARGLRLAGEPAAAYEALAAVAAELESSDERADLEQRLEAVRFGGSRPDGGELEAIERRLERTLQELRPDPDGERRARLGLRPRQPSPKPEETPG